MRDRVFISKTDIEGHAMSRIIKSRLDTEGFFVPVKSSCCKSNVVIFDRREGRYLQFQGMTMSCLQMSCGVIDAIVFYVIL